MLLDIVRFVGRNGAGIAAALALTNSAVGQSNCVSFTPLGSFQGGTSSATAVSSDGMVVVGTSHIGGPNGERAFRWTRAGGMQNLGTLGSTTYGTAVSSDGSVVVGFSRLSPFGPFRAFRWTAQNGMVDLGTLRGATVSMAYGVSGDGSVIVGDSGLPRRAVRWTTEHGMESLAPTGGTAETSAIAASEDGSVIVGYTLDFNANPNYSAFRWTKDLGMVALAAQPGFTPTSASSVSSNGSFIMGGGRARGGTADLAFAMSDDTKLTILGLLPQHTHPWSASYAWDFISNERLIVGYSLGYIESSRGACAPCQPQADPRAVAWNDGQILDLTEALQRHGIDLSGGALQVATGISSDGRVIVGNNYNAMEQAWIAELPLPHFGTDITSDGQINIDDLIEVIDDWGPCSPQSTCPADVFPSTYGDCTVDMDDLLAVLGTWD